MTPLKENDVIFTKDTDIARVLNNQFVSVFSKDDGITPENLGPTPGCVVNKITIKSEVVKLLSRSIQS